MTEECIESGPFTMEFDGNGGVTITPDRGAYRCWQEVRNGRLCWCCYTAGGIYCYPMFALELLGEAPEDPGMPEAT